MTVVTTLLDRNERYATRHQPGLPILPRLNLCVVACPDPRADPAIVLGLEPGDATVVRAAGGRIAPIVLQQLLLLQAAGASAGQSQTDLELILMTHTGCGITRMLGPEHRQGLAAFLGCTEEELESKSVDDPEGALRVDIEALAVNPFIPSTLAVTGLVFDVETGRTHLVERRAPLRP